MICLHRLHERKDFKNNMLTNCQSCRIPLHLGDSDPSSLAPCAEPRNAGCCAKGNPNKPGASRGQPNFLSNPRPRGVLAIHNGLRPRKLPTQPRLHNAFVASRGVPRWYQHRRPLYPSGSKFFSFFPFFLSRMYLASELELIVSFRRVSVSPTMFSTTIHISGARITNRTIPTAGLTRLTTKKRAST